MLLFSYIKAYINELPLNAVGICLVLFSARLITQGTCIKFINISYVNVMNLCDYVYT